MRKAAEMEVIESGVPIDVLWFRLNRNTEDPEQLLGNINYGKALILINRGDYFQAGLIIQKGSFERIKETGINGLRDVLLKIAPFLGGRVQELQDWNQIQLLSVQINRLRRWYQTGLLCIGDAAHAMSPAGGVGINLAIQDAVATANLLSLPLAERRVTNEHLIRVQDRREFPTRVTQFLQLNAHRLFARIFQIEGPIKAPWQLRAVVRVPGLQDVMARIIGVGIRPEHIADANKRPCANRSVRIGAALGASLGALAALVMRTRCPQNRIA